jgi:hypothetical protein
MVAGVVLGQVIGFVGSFAAVAEGKPGLLIISIPVGLAFFGLAVLSLINVILQIISLVQIAMGTA